MLSKVNKNLVPMKAHFFLFNAGTGPLVPFLTIYARQLGFSSIIVGLIYTIIPVCGMLAKPIMGAIADRFKCQKAIFLASILMCAISFLGLKYSPELPVKQEVRFSCEGEAVFDTSPLNNSVDNCMVTAFQLSDGIVDCKLDCPMEEKFWGVINQYWKLDQNFSRPFPSNLKFTAHVPKALTENFNPVIFTIKNITLENDNKIYKPICPTRISSICEANCNDFALNDLIKTSAINDNEVSSEYQFWIFLFLMIFMWTSQAITVSVGDAICFEMLGDKPHQYGNQRLFGALGWGIITIITGVMVDGLSYEGTKKNYSSAFYLAISFLILDFIVSSQIKYTQRKHSTNILRDVFRLLIDVRIIVFLVWCIALGMCTGLIWQFLFWLVEDLAKEQGCGYENWLKTLEGLIMAIQTLCGEMPFFFLSGWILKRIGHTNAMSLIPLVIGIRYILYSVIVNPWYFLPIELLNGLTFGLFYACMASYASIVAPPGTEATMQGLVGAIFEGVGVSLGSIVAGLLYQDFGGPLTFRIFGIGSLIVCLLHAGMQYLLKTKDTVARYTSPKDALTIIDDDQQELTLVGS